MRTDPLRKLLSEFRQHPTLILLSLGLLAIIGAGGTVAGQHVWAWHHVRAAEEALERRDFANAKAHLTSSLKVLGGSAEIHLLAARAARRAGDYDEAEQHLKRCRELDWVAKEIDLERDLLRAQHGDLARVENYLLALVEQDHPQAVLILEALTRGYLKTYGLSRARHCLQLWLDRRPDDLQALLWRAEVAERRSSQREALADYLRVLELDPQHDTARLRAAEILVGSNQPEAAIGHFLRLYERQPENTAVVLGLARCRRLLGEPEEAGKLLNLLSERSPDDAGVLCERGRLALETGQFAEAERLLRRAALRAPSEREIHYVLFLCLQQRGKTGEAKECLAKLDGIDAQLKRLRELTLQISDSPHDPALRHEAGMIFLRSGQEKEGLRWLQSALQEDPEFEPTRRALAEYAQRAGEQVTSQ